MFKKLQTWQLYFMVCISIQMMPTKKSIYPNSLNIRTLQYDESTNSRTLISDAVYSNSINSDKRKYRRKAELYRKQYLKEIEAKKIMDKLLEQERQKNLAISVLAIEGKPNTLFATIIYGLLKEEN